MWDIWLSGQWIKYSEDISGAGQDYVSRNDKMHAAFSRLKLIQYNQFTINWLGTLLKGWRRTGG